MKSQNQLKNHVILYYISVSTCQITHMRIATVQPPILCKKNFHYTISMGVNRYENLILYNIEIILIVINGCMSDL